MCVHDKHTLVRGIVLDLLAPKFTKLKKKKKRIKLFKCKKDSFRSDFTIVNSFINESDVNVINKSLRNITISISTLELILFYSILY